MSLKNPPPHRAVKAPLLLPASWVEEPVWVMGEQQECAAFDSTRNQQPAKGKPQTAQRHTSVITVQEGTHFW